MPACRKPGPTQIAVAQQEHPA